MRSCSNTYALGVQSSGHAYNALQNLWPRFARIGCRFLSMPPTGSTFPHTLPNTPGVGAGGTNHGTLLFRECGAELSADTSTAGHSDGWCRAASITQLRRSSYRSRTHNLCLHDPV